MRTAALQANTCLVTSYPLKSSAVQNSKTDHDINTYCNTLHDCKYCRKIWQFLHNAMSTLTLYTTERCVLDKVRYHLISMPDWSLSLQLWSWDTRLLEKVVWLNSNRMTWGSSSACLLLCRPGKRWFSTATQQVLKTEKFHATPLVCSCCIQGTQNSAAGCGRVAAGSQDSRALDNEFGHGSRQIWWWLHHSTPDINPVTVLREDLPLWLETRLQVYPVAFKRNAPVFLVFWIELSHTFSSVVDPTPTDSARGSAPGIWQSNMFTFMVLLLLMTCTWGRILLLCHWRSCVYGDLPASTKPQTERHQTFTRNTRRWAVRTRKTEK